MNGFDWPKHLRSALEATKFMALASQGTKGLWNHAVFFAFDENLKIIFISQPNSRHMKNISSNGEVALAIFSTSQSPTEDVIGLQIRGHAQVLPDDQVARAHATYYGRSPEVPGIDATLDSYLGENAEWKFVEVRPEEIGYFDTRHFAERQTVPQGVRL